MNSRMTIHPSSPFLVRLTSGSHVHGFSLIELMLAMAISLFLIGGVALIHFSSRTSSIETERLSRVQENIRFISDYLVREMRNAGFRDQLSLTINGFNTIGEAFAEIGNEGDGDSITLRFSGRGSCSEELRAGNILISDIVTNTYFVKDGELRCTGQSGDNPARTVALVSGIRDLQFDFMCPAGSSGCSCALWQHGEDFDAERASLADACYGVRIGLLFEPPDNAAGTDPVAVELSSSFRNVVLGNMMWNGVPN